MQVIIYLALIAACIAAARLSPGRAMLAVYLPVLLILPDTFFVKLPGIPNTSFNQAAIFPIFAVALMRYGPRWRPSVADLLIIAFCAVVIWSEYTNVDFFEARNLAYAMFSKVLAPYLLARLVIARERLHVATARVFVGILFGLAIAGLFEARFGFNPLIAFFQHFFPGQGNWVTTFRHGIARVAGPYAHAILAGIMMIMAYRLQRWLEWGNHWEPRFKHLPVKWSKARVITVWIIIGSLLTVARGPWLGGLVGGAFAFVGRSRKRHTTLYLMLAAMIAVSIPGAIFFSKYLDIKPGQVMTDSQESALYRKELMDKYVDIAREHLWFGWGRNTWPKVPGMPSIDNYYLLLSLMHGLAATLLLLAVSIWLGVRLLHRGLNEPPGHNSLSFAFLGMIIAVLVSLATVYLGENVMPAFFFVLGWAESLLKDPASDPGLQSNATNGTGQPALAQPMRRFRRVMR